MSEQRAGPNYKVWYRIQYLNSVCHICKIVPENGGITCPKCRLIVYCNMEHLEDDIDDHEELCEALTVVAKQLGTDHALDKAYLLGPDQLREFRLGLISLCGRIMQRPLLPWEMEVCLFPPICATCHKFQQTLTKCPDCFYTKWCSPQHRPKNHNKFCSQLDLFRRILQKRNHVIPSVQLTELPKTMKELPTLTKDQIEFCLLSEIATSPFSILNAIQTQLTLGANVIVHVIGPEPNFEANNLVKWESLLFDLLPTSVEYLQLAFVGPEIGPLNKRTINRGERKLDFTFYPVLYHDYASNLDIYTKPDLIVALNAGLYRTAGFQGMDTWNETIKSMFINNGVPVLVTAYTEKEMLLDYKRVKGVISNLKVLIAPSINPFRSERPLMNFVSDDATPIVYKNAYHTLLAT